MNSFIFLFLFSIQGDETAYSVVPQPSIEVCENNGVALTRDSQTYWTLHSAPFNYYQCVDMSKPLISFKWNLKNEK